MKVSNWVDIGQEVEIEIGLDEIRGVMAEAFANVDCLFDNTDEQMACLHCFDKDDDEDDWADFEQV